MLYASMLKNYYSTLVNILHCLATLGLKDQNSKYVNKRLFVFILPVVSHGILSDLLQTKHCHTNDVSLVKYFYFLQ